MSYISFISDESGFSIESSSSDVCCRFQPDHTDSRRSSSDTESEDEGMEDSFTEDRNPEDEIFLQDKCLDTLIEGKC